MEIPKNLSWFAQPIGHMNEGKILGNTPIKVIASFSFSFLKLGISPWKSILYLWSIALNTHKYRTFSSATLRTISGFFVFFPKIYHFFLKMGEQFAHFEKKWETFGKNTKKIRNFLAIFPSVAAWLAFYSQNYIWRGFCLGLDRTD